MLFPNLDFEKCAKCKHWSCWMNTGKGYCIIGNDPDYAGDVKPNDKRNCPSYDSHPIYHLVSNTKFMLGFTIIASVIVIATVYVLLY